MSRDTQQEIRSMVHAVEDMAVRYFADSKFDPFETHVSSGDDHSDHVRVVADGVRLGLCDHFEPSTVSVQIIQSGYQIKIERP